MARTPRLRPSRAALAATGRAIHEEQMAHDAAAPRGCSVNEYGIFPVITPVGSTTTHAGRYEGNFTVPACTGQQLADPGYALSDGITAKDVSCKRCKPLVPAPVVARRPQINHKRCNHPQTPAARRECRTAQRAVEAAAKYEVGQVAMVKLDDAPPMKAEITQIQIRSYLRFGKIAAVLTYVAVTERTRTVVLLDESRVLHVV